MSQQQKNPLDRLQQPQREVPRCFSPIWLKAMVCMLSRRFEPSENTLEDVTKMKQQEQPMTCYPQWPWNSRLLCVNQKPSVPHLGGDMCQVWRKCLETSSLKMTDDHFLLSDLEIQTAHLEIKHIICTHGEAAKEVRNNTCYLGERSRSTLRRP